MKRIEALHLIRQIRGRIEYLHMETMDSTLNRLLDNLEQGLIHPEPVEHSANFLREMVNNQAKIIGEQSARICAQNDKLRDIPLSIDTIPELWERFRALEKKVASFPADMIHIKECIDALIDGQRRIKSDMDVNQPLLNSLAVMASDLQTMTSLFDHRSPPEGTPNGKA